jgi:hypothetical protein
MMVKAHYEIQVKKVKDKDDGKTYAEAKMPRELKHGKTVHYSTTGKPGNRGAEVTITFKKGKTPYLNPNGTEITKVTSNEPPIVLSPKTGHFFGACSIATKHKDKNGNMLTSNFGYRKGPVYGGGNHNPGGGNHNVT